MSNVIQLGPFVIRSDWLYYGLSVFLGFMITRIVVKRKSAIYLPYLDSVFNALFVGIIIWKLSPVISNIKILLNPLTLLLYPGTSIGVILAFLGSLIFLVITGKKNNVEWRSMLDVLSILFVSSGFVYVITHWQYGLPTTLPWGISLSDPTFRYHPINVYQIILFIPLLWMMIRGQVGRGHIASIGFVGYGIASLGVSLLQNKSPVLLNLAAGQWIALGMIVIGLLAVRRQP